MMKKKLCLLISVVLALTLSLGALAGCGSSVELSKTELVLAAGATSTLRATDAKDASAEVTWSSDKESVATVDAKGKVTGVAAGTAKVKAKTKNGSATCKVSVVKFTFEVGGVEVTTLNVDRNEAPVQLTVTTSDNSAITGYTSADPTIVTVSDDGVVTGLKDGSTTLTVKTADCSATINVIVGDSFTGEKYALKDASTVEGAWLDGIWYYYAATYNGRVTNINAAEYRGGVITFDVSGEGNWGQEDRYIGVKNYSLNGEGGWYELSMKINSNIATTLTVHDTAVDIVAGDNDVTVYFQQWGGASAIIFMGNGEEGTQPSDIKLVISDVDWKEFTPVNLEAPSIALNGTTVNITDSNAKGVKNYQVGLFKNASDRFPVDSKTIKAKSAPLDLSTVEETADYIVKVRAIGVTGFTDSGWSTANDVTLHVEAAPISYTLRSTPTSDNVNDGGGAATALKSGKWDYFACCGSGFEGASVTSVKFEDGTLTFVGNKGWSADSTMFFRNYAQYDAGTRLTVTMTLTSTVGGDIRVVDENGDKIITMVAGQAQTVTYNVVQATGKCTIVIMLGTVAEDDSEWPGKLMASTSMQYGDLTFSISNVSVSEAQ